MPLRSIAARLRHHDWTAVAMELLIVIVGVFIGLQVSNWNDERKETARGREYLQRLHDELLRDAKGIEVIAAFWTQVGNSGLIALRYSEDGVLEHGSPWKTVLAYYQASQVWPYRKPDVTFQEIRSTGNLLLIRDPALRDHIARHYSAGAGSQVTEVLGLIPRYREHVRGLVPWKVQTYIWNNCYEATDAIQTLKDCPAPISDAEAIALLQQLRDNPDLTAELRFWMVNVHNGLVLMRDVRKEAQSLANELRVAKPGA